VIRIAGAGAALAAVLLGAAACSGGPPAPRGATPPPAAHSTGTGAAAGGRPPARPPGTLAGYYAQRLNWQPCDNGFECARLLVPFSYGRPGWRRFSLPVIRLPATNPAERIGALVINPGGPGGSGVQYALAARGEFTSAVLSRFDIVGFDPRGVGGSEPALRCMSGPQLDRYFQTDDEPSSAAQLAAVVAESRLYAAECARNAGGLLPYVGTRDAARDMDVLRAALGDPTLTYLGKSYGTYLGTWYAQLFPHRIRALVLDGAVDPDSSGLDVDISQAKGFEVAFSAFAASCMAGANCPLGHGAPVAAGVTKLRGLIAQANRAPLANNLDDGQAADGALLLTGVSAALYSKSFWPTLQTALSAAFSGDGTLLVELANDLTERSANGTYSNLADVDTAVTCLDRPSPRSLAAWQAAAATAARAAPLFGAPIVWGSLPCAYWPLPAFPLPRISASGAPPVLVVGNLRDPATPYQWARALARDLSSGVLLGWNGDGHTAYMQGSSCVDNAVDSYLISLTVPRNGTVCP